MPHLSITRGTNPTITFTLPESDAAVSSAKIIFAQRRSGIRIEKNLADCSVAEGKIILQLKQQDTVCLERGGLEMQLRLGMGGGAYASPIYRLYVKDVLADGVIKV